MHAGRKLVDSSAGTLPPLAECRFEALGGNHLNMAIRAFKAEVSSDQSALTDESGRISLAKILAGQPALENACKDGLCWNVLHRCLHDIPELKSYIQQALNYDAREGLSELELIRSAFRRPPTVL